MRAQLIGAVMLLASCTSPPADPAEVAQFVVGPDCQGDKLTEVLERVDQGTSTRSNPVADQIDADRNANFGPLAALVGRCFKGTPTDESSEQIEDIQYWAWGLGGAAITIEHAFTDGSYGGISYVYPKSGSEDFTYVYITNAGFHTQGTISLNDDQSFTATETVDGHPTITEVRSVTNFDGTGVTSMTSEFFDDGIWKPGPGFTHEVTTEPFPRLRTAQANPEE